MKCTKRNFLKILGITAAVAVVQPVIDLSDLVKDVPSFCSKAFAQNPDKEKEKYEKLRKDLYKDLSSLTGWCETNKLYSENKHLASLIIELYAEDKEKYDSAVKALDFDMEYVKDGKSKIKDMPAVSIKERESFAKAYSKIAKKYSKKFFDLGKKLEKQKKSDAQEALKLVELKEQCMDAALRLTPYDARLRKYLKIEDDISENKDSLESQHFKIKKGDDPKKTKALLEAAEEYYDFFTQEFGRYVKIEDISGKIEINRLLPEKYEKICKDEQFKNMRGFADEKSIYLRKIDKNDKNFLKKWMPLRSEQDVLREALFNLFCYKRIDQPSEPVHMDSKNRKVFSLVRGFSVFFSSKPELNKRASSSAYKLYQIPETDKTLHTNFLRHFSKQSPDYIALKNEPESPKKDAAYWGRLNFSYFAEDLPNSRRDINFVLAKWAFSGDLDTFESFFQKEEADNTTNYIKGKKR